MRIDDSCHGHITAEKAIQIDKKFYNKDAAVISYNSKHFFVTDTEDWTIAEMSALNEIVGTNCEYVVHTNYSKPKPKETEGKPVLSLVPRGIVEAVARVREFGNKKYGNPDGWKMMSKQDYWEACLRHAEAARNNVDAVDSESGLLHIEHLACDLSFILSGELK